MTVVTAMVALFLVGGAAWKDGAIWGATVASWVQGIGTLMAFGAAIWAGTAPARIERERRKSFAAGVIHSADLALRQLETVERYCTPGNYGVRPVVRDYYKSGVPEIFAAMLRTPFEAWPSPELFIRVKQLDAKLAAFVAAAVVAFEMDEASAPVAGLEPGDWAGVAQHAAWTRNWYTRTIEEAERLRA